MKMCAQKGVQQSACSQWSDGRVSRRSVIPERVQRHTGTDNSKFMVPENVKLNVGSTSDVRWVL